MRKVKKEPVLEEEKVKKNRGSSRALLIYVGTRKMDLTSFHILLRWRIWLLVFAHIGETETTIYGRVFRSLEFYSECIS